MACGIMTSVLIINVVVVFYMGFSCGFNHDDPLRLLMVNEHVVVGDQQSLNEPPTTTKQAL